MCRQHYDETGGCWCKSQHEEVSLIAGKKNKEYCFRLSLPSSTSEQLDILPSSSGLPPVVPPPPPEKEEKKPEINLKRRIEKLQGSVLYLQQEIENLKKEKLVQDEKINDIKKQSDLNEKHIKSYKLYVPPMKKEKKYG